MCNCEFCQLHRRIKMVVRNASHQQKNRLILELADLYWNTEEDRDYLVAIKSGNWPGSEEILAKWLQNAKEQNQKVPDAAQEITS